jgi:hypothetical protein
MRCSLNHSAPFLHRSSKRGRVEYMSSRKRPRGAQPVRGQRASPPCLMTPRATLAVTFCESVARHSRGNEDAISCKRRV